MTRQELWKSGQAGKLMTKRDLGRLRRAPIEDMDLPVKIHLLHPPETAVPPTSEDDPARVRVIAEIRAKLEGRMS